MSHAKLVAEARWRPNEDAESACVLVERALELLVLQPSPFCNLDCRYCYLPNRTDRRRMSMDGLEAALRKVVASRLLGPRLSVVWHAGEPMAVPREWYEEAFALVARHLAEVHVEHHFQTNAMGMDDAWCRFFRRHDVQIGVSVDGPAFLHDRHRRTRDGKGTHARVMRSIGRLKAAGIGFHVIAVLTRDSLDHPDAIYDFFAGLGARQVGFNVEEIELDNPRSTLAQDGTEAALVRFWRRLLQRLRDEPGRLRIREVESLLRALRSPAFGRLPGNQQNQAGRILSVSWDGAYCFWSPELLGARHAVHGPMTLGTVHDSSVALGAEVGLAVIQQEIDDGIASCRAECRYFDFCLGGAPVNKLCETGGFAATETMACRLAQKVVIDAVLEELDSSLPPAHARGGDHGGKHSISGIAGATAQRTR